MPEIFETNPMYRIEYELINQVKIIREKNNLSQRTLSKKMGLNVTFVSNCESLDEKQKYNLRHIGILKSIFKLESLDEFFPEGVPSDELIKIKYTKKFRTKRDGKDSKQKENEIVEIVVISDEINRGVRLKKND